MPHTTNPSLASHPYPPSATPITPTTTTINIPPTPTPDTAAADSALNREYTEMLARRDAEKTWRPIQFEAFKASLRANKAATAAAFGRRRPKLIGYEIREFRRYMAEKAAEKAVAGAAAAADAVGCDVFRPIGLTHGGRAEWLPCWREERVQRERGEMRWWTCVGGVTELNDGVEDGVGRFGVIGRERKGLGDRLGGGVGREWRDGGDGKGKRKGEGEGEVTGKARGEELQVNGVGDREDESVTECEWLIDAADRRVKEACRYFQESEPDRSEGVPVMKQAGLSGDASNGQRVTVRSSRNEVREMLEENRSRTHKAKVGFARRERGSLRDQDAPGDRVVDWLYDGWVRR